MFSKTFLSLSRILRKVEAHLQPEERHQASAVPIVAAGHLQHQDDSQDPNDTVFHHSNNDSSAFQVGCFTDSKIKTPLEWLAWSATMGNIRQFSSVSHSDWPWASFSWL